MDSIDSVINELLYKHDCVVLPRFGGFVAKKTPSKIDFEKGLIFPPSKQILFNPNLLEDDGLLKHAICKKNSMSYNESTLFLKNLFENWNTQLEKGEPVEFKDLGEIFKDKSGRYTFIQDDFSNHLINSFGLSEILIEPMLFSDENYEEKIEVDQYKSKPIKWIKIATKYAAILLITLTAFYSYWIPSQTEFLKSGMLHWSDFNPFHESNKPTYNPKILKLDRTTGLNSKSKKQDKVGIQPSSKKEMVNDLVDENNNKSEKSSLPEKSYGEIKVVVGCFSQRKNIERFMNKLSVQGFAPFEEKHGRLTRVCIKATNEMSEAREFVAKSRSLGFKGWILK